MIVTCFMTMDNIVYGTLLFTAQSTGPRGVKIFFFGVFDMMSCQFEGRIVARSECFLHLSEKPPANEDTQ